MTPEAKRPCVLYIAYVGMYKADSGSSRRPRQMYEAFCEICDVKLLCGDDLRIKKSERISAVNDINAWLDGGARPDFCYIESPSGPIVFAEDRALIRRLHRLGVPVAYFYRDAYYKLGSEFFDKSQSLRETLRNMYNHFSSGRTDRLLKHNASRVYFPSMEMAKYFPFSDAAALPPGTDAGQPVHEADEYSIYVGGASEQYGTPLMLKAFSLANMQIDAPLTLICRESEMSAISAEYLNSPWLRVVHASGEVLRGYYARAAFALFPQLPSRYNNFAFPIKLVDYVSYGMPIVGVRKTESGRFIDRYGLGVLTGPDATELSRAIITMFTDEELRAKCRANAEKARAENTWLMRARQVTDEMLSYSQAK